MSLRYQTSALETWSIVFAFRPAGTVTVDVENESGISRGSGLTTVEAQPGLYRLDSSQLTVQPSSLETLFAVATDALGATQVAIRVVGGYVNAVALLETEAAAATREATNTTEHGTTQVAIAALPAAPSAAVNATAVWAALQTANVAIGSMGQQVDRLLGFAGQSNVMLDGGPNAASALVPDYDAAGLMTEGRMRTFRTAVNRANATPGNIALQTGELYRQHISATSTTPGQADAYNSDRDT